MDCFLVPVRFTLCVQNYFYYVPLFIAVSFINCTDTSSRLTFLRGVEQAG
jgi:hypothetical protein